MSSKLDLWNIPTLRKPNYSNKDFKRTCSRFEELYDEYVESDNQVDIETKNSMSKTMVILRNQKKDYSAVLVRNKNIISQLKKFRGILKEEISKLEILAKNSLLVMASNNLSRVECPSKEAIRCVNFGKKKVADKTAIPELLFPEDLLLQCCTENCPPGPFTELYNLAVDIIKNKQPVNNNENEDEKDNNIENIIAWECTPADAVKKGKDLLGMCPGTILHETEEKRTRKFINKKGEEEIKRDEDGKPIIRRCHCDYCKHHHKIKSLKKDLKQIKKDLSKADELKTTAKENRSRAITLLKQMAPTTKKEKRTFDPVFEASKTYRKKIKRLHLPNKKKDGKLLGDDEAYLNEWATDDDEEEGDNIMDGLSNKQLIRMARSQEIWSTLSETLTVDDLPLRVAFLDKSGSMGCDETTFNALMLALHNVMHPKRGSTLTLLMAAPGETQILLRRPSDPPINRFNICLGSSTWFNEPLVKTLEFIAPILKKIDFQSFIRENGEPPVQILALTDGQDNVSIPRLAAFGPMIQAIKQIKHSNTGELVYKPLVPFSNKPSSMDDQRCPLWLCWMAAGIGGGYMLQDQVLQQKLTDRKRNNVSKLPTEILFIDATTTPIVREYMWDDSDWGGDESSSSDDNDDDGNDDSDGTTDTDDMQDNNSKKSNVPIENGLDIIQSEYFNSEEKNGMQPHYLKETKASKANKKISKKNIKRQAKKIVGHVKRDTDWRTGNRVKVTHNGRKVFGTILRKKGKYDNDDEQKDEEQIDIVYEVLVDSQGKQNIPSRCISGKPRKGKSMLLKTTKEKRSSKRSITKNKGPIKDPAFFVPKTTCGIQARQNADPEIQSKQVLTVVNGVTTDMRNLFMPPSELKVGAIPRGRVLPMEVAAAICDNNKILKKKRARKKSGGNDDEEKTDKGDGIVALEEGKDLGIMDKIRCLESNVKVRNNPSKSDDEEIEEKDTNSSEGEEEEIAEGVEEHKSPMNQIKKVKKKGKKSIEVLHASLIQRAMKVLGKSSRPVMTSQRDLALKLCSVGIEYLYWGGTLYFPPKKDVTEGILLEQLGDFIGLSPHRMQTTPGFALGGDRSKRLLDQLKDIIEQPLSALLKFLILENILTVSKEGEKICLLERKRMDLRVLWRFLDPSLLPKGIVDDSLRVCINHADLLKRPPAFKKSPPQLKTLAANRKNNDKNVNDFDNDNSFFCYTNKVPRPKSSPTSTQQTMTQFSFDFYSGNQNNNNNDNNMRNYNKRRGSYKYHTLY